MLDDDLRDQIRRMTKQNGATDQDELTPLLNGTKPKGEDVSYGIQLLIRRGKRCIIKVKCDSTNEK